MQTEVRETVELYLDGKIQQWYARGDGKGVVFLMNCKTVDEAKAVLEGLPLAKEHYVTFDYNAAGAAVSAPPAARACCPVES